MRVGRAAFAFALLLVAVLACAEGGNQRQHSKKQACQILRKHMARVEGLPNGIPPKQWFCDFSVQETAEYYIVALHDPDPTRPPGEIYSSSMGWFAVSKTTTMVMKWDINEDKAIPIPRDYYGIRAHPK